LQRLASYRGIRARTGAVGQLTFGRAADGRRILPRTHRKTIRSCAIGTTVRPPIRRVNGQSTTCPGAVATGWSSRWVGC